MGASDQKKIAFEFQHPRAFIPMNTVFSSSMILLQSDDFLREILKMTSWEDNLFSQQNTQMISNMLLVFTGLKYMDHFWEAFFVTFEQFNWLGG